MKNSNNTGIAKEAMNERLATVERANVTSVLMAQLCKELGLEPMNTTHQQFVDAFTALQKQSLEYQKELQEMYISSTQVKPKQKRRPKGWSELEDDLIPEKTDTFSNGDYK